MMKKSNPGSKVTSPSGQQKPPESSGMSEDQVKTIIQNCNAQLKEISDQTDGLKQEYTQLDKSIQAIQHQIQQINLDYDNIKVDALHAEKLYTLLKKYNEEIHFIQQAYYFEGNQNTLQCPKLSSVDQMIKVNNFLNICLLIDPSRDRFICKYVLRKSTQNKLIIFLKQKEIEKTKADQPNKQTILAFLQTLRQKIVGNLVQEQRIQQIEKISSKYAQEFENMRKALSTTTFCTNCKELFLPEQNHETACFYHPGKLKYFSCRGCGADDYYTCCLKCSRCCIGCANSAHIP